MITHYLALRDSLAQRILDKEIVGGAKLPSERLLQTEFGVARGTVREALFQLEAEGLIYRRDRSGWYVSHAAVSYDPTRWAGFMTYVAEQGRSPTTETLSKQTEAAPDAVSIFGGPPEQPLHVIRRRRAIDGHPVLVERIIVHPDLAPGLLEYDLNQSLTQVLKTVYGVSVARNRVTMRPCALVKDEAVALGVKSGTPGLLVERTSFAADGRVVEYDREYWRHDAIVIGVDIGVA